MDLAYNLVKVLHILLMAIAVGFNASYGIWLARAGGNRAERRELSHILRGIKFLDDRFANPAYGLLLVTGLTMIFLSSGRWSLTTFWILAALILYAVMIVVGLALYTPTLREQIRVLESQGPDSADFRSASARGRVIGMALIVPVLIIVVLMVLKPTL